jgi:adenylosuccinate synthase
MASRLAVVVGGQFGSEAKGHVTGYLATVAAQEGREVTAVRVAGPNAGHTAHDRSGRPWALRQIPVVAVTNPEASLVIGAGSEIDLEVLAKEIDSLEGAGIPVRNRLFVDLQATILTEDHHQAEVGMRERLGSTAKGIGAARADRIQRRAQIVRDVLDHQGTLLGCQATDTAQDLRRQLTWHRATVLIEGTQGYGLGLHAGFYPFCTSSDCRAIDFLAMAGLYPDDADEYQVWVTARVNPIRVAGNSGPLLGETTWEALGLSEEKTTVTKLVRRVGAWDPELIGSAVQANGGARTVSVALTMLDHRFPQIRGARGDFGHTLSKLGHYEEIESAIRVYEEDTGAPIALIGTGPDSMLSRSPE